MTSFVFRAVAGVVNTAAWAANSLLEVMYPPRHDAAHIWDDDDVPAGSVASGGPAPTGPTPGVVADPAEGATPPAPSAGSLTWEAWAVPAILEVLAEHKPRDMDEIVLCSHDTGALVLLDWGEWREHIAPILAEHLGYAASRCPSDKSLILLRDMLSYPPK